MASSPPESHIKTTVGRPRRGCQKRVWARAWRSLSPLVPHWLVSDIWSFPFRPAYLDMHHTILGVPAPLVRSTKQCAHVLSLRVVESANCLYPAARGTPTPETARTQ